MNARHAGLSEKQPSLSGCYSPLSLLPARVKDRFSLSSSAELQGNHFNHPSEFEVNRQQTLVSVELTDWESSYQRVLINRTLSPVGLFSICIKFRGLIVVEIVLSFFENFQKVIFPPHLQI